MLFSVLNFKDTSSERRHEYFMIQVFGLYYVWVQTAVNKPKRKGIGHMKLVLFKSSPIMNFTKAQKKGKCNR